MRACGNMLPFMLLYFLQADLQAAHTVLQQREADMLKREADLNGKV